MYVSADFTLVPICDVAAQSMHKFIQKCQQQLEQSGLVYRLHAHGTNIEGEFDSVMKTMKNCIVALENDMNVKRVHAQITLDHCVDKQMPSLDERVAHVTQAAIEE